MALFNKTGLVAAVLAVMLGAPACATTPNSASAEQPPISSTAYASDGVTVEAVESLLQLLGMTPVQQVAFTGSAPKVSDLIPPNHQWMPLPKTIPTAQNHSVNISYTPISNGQIYYYDEFFELIDKPAANGYYRKLIGRMADGRPVVQDFYQANGAIHGTPIALIKGENVADSMAAHDNVTYLFTPEGKLDEVMRIFPHRNFEAVMVKDGRYVGRMYANFDELGQVFAPFFLNGAGQIEAYAKMTLLDDLNTTSALFYPSGQAKYYRTINFNDKTMSEAAWDDKGSRITPTLEMRIKASEALQKASDLYYMTDDVASEPAM